MTKTEIYIMGYAVQIAYAIHHPDYVEWKLVASKTWEGEHDLLNVLLRVHYHQYIEAAIREHAFMEQYAAAAGHGFDDSMDAMSYYETGNNLFNDTDLPF